MNRILVYVAGVLLSFLTPVYGSEIWLPVLATEKDLLKGIERFKALGGKKAGIDLISSSDCSNLRDGYYLVIDGKKEAKDNLNEWKGRGISDGYVKKCEVIKNSRLDLNINLIDDSIYNRPDTIINWSYEDAISYTKVLNNSIVAVVQPKYQSDPEDIREGLRISVAAIFIKAHQFVDLIDDCIDPEFSAKDDYIAVSCVTATMADHLLHAINVYNMPNKKPLLIIDRCKSPRFVKERLLLCEKEVLNKDGELATNTVEFSF
jgi:hypothetical protein